MKAGMMPYFLLFSHLSLNQQKVSSSDQVGEHEIFSTHVGKKKKISVCGVFCFIFCWPRSQGHQKVLNCRLKDI